MATALADLYVSIGAKLSGLQKGFAEAKGQAAGAGSQIAASLSGKLAGLIGFAAITGGLYKSVQGAADLGETLSKVGQVFGPGAAKVEAQAEAMAVKFGLVKGPLLDAAAGIGLIGKASGLSQDDAADMANKMAMLAADASSFYNVPLDESLDKIKSALVGESEPIRSFGVLLNEAAVKSEAMALGLYKGTGAMSEQIKVAARASLIEKGLSDATGDLDRTSDSTSNQMRKFTGGLTNLSNSIGAALLPAVNAIVTVLNEFTVSATASFGQAQGSIGIFGSTVVSIAGAVSFAFRNIGDIWELVTIGVREGVENIIAVFQAMFTNLGIIGNWLGSNWVALITDAVTAVGTVFQNLGTNIGNLAVSIFDFFKTGSFNFDWTPLLTSFKATADKLPELAKPVFVSLDAEKNAVLDRIGKREQDRADALAKPKGPAPAAVDAGTGAGPAAKEKKTAITSLEEFSKGLLTSAFGQKDDSTKRTADASERTAVAVEKLAEKEDKKGGKGNVAVAAGPA